MKTVTLTMEQAKELLNLAVQDKGSDYVYPPSVDESLDSVPRCSYFEENGAPSCIIGHVLAYAGMTLEDVGRLNSDLAVDVLVSDGYLIVDEETKDYLMTVQTLQDGGAPWGYAVVHETGSVQQAPSPVTV